MVTFKGTDKDIRCRGGFQYELGKLYTDDGAIRCGGKGFHSCECPMDVLSYFQPKAGHRYFQCEVGGTIDRKADGDSKIASSELTLKAEIGLAGLINAQSKWVKKMATRHIAQGPMGHAAAQGDRGHAAAQGLMGHAAAQGLMGHAAAQGDRGHAAAQGDRGHAAAQGDRGHAAAQGDMGHAAAQGDRGHAAAQGDMGHAAAQGDRSHAAAQGDRGHADVHGKDAIAASFGIEGTAQGELHDWLVLAEWEFTDAWHIKSVKTVKVDGISIKPNIRYRLIDGEFVEDLESADQ